MSSAELQGVALEGRLKFPSTATSVQPAMAAVAAIHDGIKDAKAGRSPYFWTVLRNPEKRVGRLREGLNATARIILLAIAMDVVYQIITGNPFGGGSETLLFTITVTPFT